MRYGRAVLFFTFLAIFLATAVVTLLGLTGQVSIDPKHLNALLTALILEVVVAVIGLFKRTSMFASERLVQVVDSIRGGWWQFVRSGDVNAVGFVVIRYNDDQQQVALSGDSYSLAGGEYARWWSVAAALNAATCQLHYFWQGDHAAGSDDYSGVGWISFEHTESKRSPDRADAWFTSGNLEDLAVTARQKADMRRATPEETRTMTSSDVAAKRRLAAAVYAAWRPAPASEVVGTTGFQTTR